MNKRLSKLSPYPGFDQMHLTVYFYKWDAAEDSLDQFLDREAARVRKHLYDYFINTPSESMAIERATNLVLDSQLAQKLIQQESK